MYTVENFKTKKALREAVTAGRSIEVYEPGIQTGKKDGEVFLEGPHYPQPHTWYAAVIIKDRIVQKVRK